MHVVFFTKALRCVLSEFQNEIQISDQGNVIRLNVIVWVLFASLLPSFPSAVSRGAGHVEGQIVAARVGVNVH